MKFYFCESCGKRLTDTDLASGQARDKQVKGVYCKDCSPNVMTMTFQAMNEAQARAFLKEAPVAEPATPKPEPRGRESEARVQAAMRKPSVRAAAVDKRPQSGLGIVAGLAAAVVAVGVLLIFKYSNKDSPAVSANEPKPASAPAVPVVSRRVPDQSPPSAAPPAIPSASKTVDTPAPLPPQEKKTTQPEPEIKSQEPMPADKTEEIQGKTAAEPKTESKTVTPNDEEEDIKPVDVKDPVKTEATENKTLAGVPSEKVAPPIPAKADLKSADVPAEIKKLQEKVPMQGIKLWLRADAGIQLSGSKVARWQDQSGQGNDATQETEFRQPEFIAKDVNGLPALHFDGRSSCLTSNCLPASGADPRTLVIVLHDAFAGTNPNRVALSYGARNKCEAYNIATVMDGHDVIGTGYHDGRMSSSQALVKDVLVVIAEYDGKTDSIYVNGAQKASQAISLNTSSNKALRVGGLINGKTEYYKGSICEILAYAHALKPDERQALEKYLMTKYGASAQR